MTRDTWRLILGYGLLLHFIFFIGLVMYITECYFGKEVFNAQGVLFCLITGYAADLAIFLFITFISFIFSLLDN